MKARIRKTGEIVDVIDYDCSHKNNNEHFVAYTDARRKYHFKEGTNLYEDFDILPDNLRYDIDWEERRYEIAKEAVRGVALNADCFTKKEIETTVNNALKLADNLIAKLKKGGQR